MLIMAFMEMIGVASIMPFVAVLANPDVIETNSYLAKAYNALSFSNPESFLFFLGLVVFILFVSSLAFKALTSYAIMRFSNMRQHTIACRLLSAYLRQPYDYFLSRNTADMGKSILSEVGQVTSGVLVPVMRLFSGIAVAAAILSLLLFIEPLMSVCVALLLGGAYGAVYIISRRLLKRIGEDRILANQQRYVLANEVLNGIKELKLLGRDQAYLSRFKEPSERFARHQATSGVIGTLPNYAIQAVAIGGVLVIVLYLLGKHEGLEGALPLITLYAYAGYRLMPAFQEIFINATRLRFYVPALESLYKDMIAKENQVLTTSQTPVEKVGLERSIKLVNVSYRYPGADVDALKELNLTITAGSSAAFVGKTGAGKSTAVDIVLGLLNPTSGQILINGQLLEKYNLRAWQDNIGYVPQSIYLADDTIAANIAFGIAEDNVNQEAVKRAAQAAHIHEFIVTELPDGYQTIVGERGIRLSGGQRQRLSIARAIYHDPDVIVFDEATSALDNSTEFAVMQAIEEMHGVKTVILIAHRLTTVRKCDQIFMLEKGQCIAQGTYQELLTNNENFRSMASTAASVG